MSKVADREVLKAFRERLDERYVMEGEYSPETSVGYSDSTGSIKTDYGVELNAGATIDGHLDEPFLFRPTAFPFNRDIITIGGQKATVKQVRAYAFVKNQLTNFNYSGSFNGVRFIGTHLEVDTGNRSISILSQQTLTDAIPAGHKVLNLLVGKAGNYSGSNINFGAYHNLPAPTTWQGQAAIPKDTDIKGKVYASVTTTTDVADTLTLFIYGTPNVNVTTKIEAEWYIIDLTKWFNNDTTILSKTNETWFIPWFLNNFGKYIPAYSTGEIENTYATQITTNGVNQFDKSTATLNNIMNADGSTTAAYGRCYSDYIRVYPTQQYYISDTTVQAQNHTIIGFDKDKNAIGAIQANATTRIFTIPDNCIYIIVNTYNNLLDTLQVCLHWTESTIEQTYHPYEKWVFNIDWSAIGTPLGINSQIGDYKDFVNGKNGKVVGSVDLGTLNWNYDSTNQYFNAQISDIKPAPNNTIVANILSAMYNTNSWNNTAPISSGQNMNIAVNGSSRMIGVRNAAYTDAATFKAAMSGVILQYELAEPTLTDMPESEKLTNTYNVNDYGTEEFDEVCALDVLYQNNLVRQIVNNQTAIADHEQRIGALETEVEGIKGLPTAPSTDGNYRLRCTVANGVATYAWVEES